jgi:uncharacterized tellurite resistance protein B-like protein
MLVALMERETAIDPRRLIVRLAVAVLAADGRITREELTALGELDELGLGHISDFARAEIERAVDAPIDIASTCGGLAALSPQSGALLVAVLADIAASDGALSRGEAAVLQTVAACFGLEPGVTEEILASKRAGVVPPTPVRERPGMNVPQALAGAQPGGAPVEEPQEETPIEASPFRQGEDRGADATASAGGAAAELVLAFAVLGLKPGARRGDVDAAYRAIVERYNPARVIDLGTEFAVLAVRKLERATAAVEVVLAAVRSAG